MTTPPAAERACPVLDCRFEPHHLADRMLVQAYERLVPWPRRPGRSAALAGADAPPEPLPAAAGGTP